MRKYSLLTAALMLVVVAALAVSPARAAPDCPNELTKRTPQEVLADHRNALATGDMDAAVCNYAEDAIVISDGGIDLGRDQIRSSLEFFQAVFGGTQPEVVQEVVVEALGNHTHMVRLLFTIDTPCIIVPDGVDTYMIHKGQIHSQTSHGFPVFQCF